MRRLTDPLRSSHLSSYAAALTGVVLTTALIHLISGAEHVANISLLYLLVVIATATRFGGRAAILASVLSVLAFDWFFVAPRHTLRVNNPAEWLALGVFLLTAFVISQLTQNLQLRAEEARQRERETQALAQVSWAIASQVSHRRTLTEVLRQLARVVPSEAAAILVGELAENAGLDELEVIALGTPEEANATLPDFKGGAASLKVRALLEQSRDEEEQPSSTKNLYHGRELHWPLVMESRVLGVLYLRRPNAAPLTSQEQRIVESLANHAAVAIERHHLTQAESRAEVLVEADKLKTALLSMVSHDFRSPLAAIKASATSLLQDGLPWDVETQRELLSGIDHETDRLNRMVGDILALSRLEAEAWRPQCEMVSLTELIGVALDGLSASENARIRVDLAPGLPELFLDSVQIAQVLANLLENALKYSPAANPVELWGAQQDDTLRIEVRDRGFGLPTGEEEQIFERFYRATQWRESSLPGSGIGLALCRGLIEAHGGQLEAFNRDGGGAIFRVILPIQTETAMQDVPFRSSSAPL